MISKIAVVPTMPNRRKYLPHTVFSIINQVQRLYVYLNGFIQTPDFLVNNKKIVCISGTDWGSAGRFFMSDKFSGYYFMLDDDIIYPPDYVEKMVAKIEQYERKAVVTLHGRILKQPLKSWFEDQETICRCMDNWANDTEIHVGGTGVMAYHTDTIKIKLDEFKHRNLDDVEFSLFAQAQKVPIVAANHTKGFLSCKSAANKGMTIWGDTRKNPAPLVKLAQAIEWKFSGIETENKDILLKAEDDEKHKWEMLILPGEKEKALWHERMGNLIARRKKASPEAKKSKDSLKRYQDNVSKIDVGEKVLDVGCGSMVLKGFLPPKTQYVGIDAFPVNSQVVRMEIEQCSYPDKHFDTTFCFAVLDSVYNLDAALAQISRVTKKNIVIFSGLDIEPDEFHTVMVTEDLLNRGLSGFEQGFKEYLKDRPKLALIEYVRKECEESKEET